MFYLFVKIYMCLISQPRGFRIECDFVFILRRVGGRRVLGEPTAERGNDGALESVSPSPCGDGILAMSEQSPGGRCCCASAIVSGILLQEYVEERHSQSGRVPDLVFRRLCVCGRRAAVAGAFSVLCRVLGVQGESGRTCPSPPSSSHTPFACCYLRVKPE